MRWTLEDLARKSAAIQAQVGLMAQARGLPPHVVAQIAEGPEKPVSVAKRATIRQKSTGLNKTEAAFLEELKRTLPEFRVYVQSFTLKIANGCRYTPDFVLIGDDGRLRAYETKGFMRDDAAVKIKVAASLYPTITFTLVTRKKGSWLYEKVLA